MDDLAALRLQLEWGADEALLDAPVDRLDRAPLRGLPPRPAPALPAPGRPAAAEPADLAALHAALEAMPHPLRATATTTVAPSGNPAAGLVLLGEAPGRDDDRSGQAYSGAPGQALDAALATAGLSRDALLLAFLVPWRPPGGREPSPAEIEACLPLLHRLLALVRPRHLVLMGQHPVRALTGQALRQVRGRWTPVQVPNLPDPIPALPMLAPEQWRKTPATRKNSWGDLLTLRSIFETG